MLSSTLNYQHYSPPFGHYADANRLSHELQQHHHHASGLDTLAESSEYALQELQQPQQSHQQNNHHPYLPPVTDRKLMMKHRHHHYRNGGFSTMERQQRALTVSDKSSRANSGSGPVRRRISRACDQCNQLRTKCDGKTPCAHCVGKWVVVYEIPESRLT